MLHIRRIVFHKISSGNNKKVLLKVTEKMNTIERVISNNNIAEEYLTSLKSELAAVKNEKIIKKKNELIEENNNLQKQVEQARQQLIQLETHNGKKQINIPTTTTAKQPEQQTTINILPEVVEQPKEEPSLFKNKAPKEKKPKKEKQAATDKPEITEAPVDVGRLDMRVGKIIEVNRHPDADTLYLEKIDCGEPMPRTVVSGLVKFIPIEEMQNRMVVVLCNLKPAKMRGVTSEAMVMCASSVEKVEVLSPPAGSVPGDLVHCEGFPRNPDAQLNPKKKIFETVAPDLKTNENLMACYKGSSLNVPGKGVILAQTLKNVQVK